MDPFLQIEAEVLQAREAALERREAALRQREAALAARQQRVEAQRAEAAALAAEATRRATELAAALVARAGEAREALRDSQIELRVERAKATRARRQRDDAADLEERAPTQARQAMALVMARYGGAAHVERVHNTIELTDRTLLGALAEAAHPLQRAFAEGAGCELSFDLERGHATVRGDDPLAREVARRLLRQLAQEAAPSAEALRATGRALRAQVEGEALRAAEEAARALDLSPLHPEVLALLGRLEFRQSYSQNQLKHSIEVARLSAMLASELGVDVMRAKRAGLLHDLGKALSHEREGAHAVLGAEVARRCGEDDIVTNAIASHHMDEEPSGAVAHVVTAADALSGARPGARRESAMQYVSRIRDIQEIAGRSRSVLRVDVMNAGREVRVIVAGEERGELGPEEVRGRGPHVLRDDELHPLAQEIARRLEDEVAFAGQIRVTVIRESRAVAVAR